jgi:hypothetical protein
MALNSLVYPGIAANKGRDPTRTVTHNVELGRKFSSKVSSLTDAMLQFTLSTMNHTEVAKLEG